MIISDVAILPERMKRELIRGENARAEFAIRAQSALKEAMDAMGPVRHIEGIGMKRATIHPELAARLQVKFRRADGLNPLNDPDFLKALLRENPFLRVQCVPGKLTLRVNGLRKPDFGNRIEGDGGKRRTPNAERPILNGEGESSRRPEREGNRPQISQIAQIKGERNGAPGDPAPTVNRAGNGPGSTLLSPGARGSVHETPSPANLRQSAKSADGNGIDHDHEHEQEHENEEAAR